VRWIDGKVSLEDSVAIPSAVTGKVLRDSFWADMPALTLGLVRVRDNSLRLGPLELMRFGPARVTRSSVQWPIEGGLAARAPGGRLRFEALYGRLVASVEGYQPMLPRALYVLTQLPVHRLWTRLHLLRVRGRQPAPGAPVDPARRVAAAAIDVGFCVALAAAIGGRRRLPVLFGIAAGYHVACWSISGRTIGGVVMKQRVVSVDGSRLSAGQAIVRLASLPLAAVRRRNVHDEIAGTDVVASNR
jgi:RDD family